MAARAKHVIYLHMVGAPSQLDLFDDKPVLKQYSGRPCPQELLEGQRFAFLEKERKLLGTCYQFARHGAAGHEISELLPHLTTVSDDIAFVHSLATDEFNHGPAQVFMATGFGRRLVTHGGQDAVPALHRERPVAGQAIRWARARQPPHRLDREALVAPRYGRHRQRELGPRERRERMVQVVKRLPDRRVFCRHRRPVCRLVPIQQRPSGFAEHRLHFGDTYLGCERRRRRARRRPG